MAINLYKDDDPNKKVGTAGVSSTGTSSIAPTPTPAPSPVPVVGDSHSTDGMGTSIEKGPEKSSDSKIETIDDKFMKICDKIRNGEALTPDEQKLYDERTATYNIKVKKADKTEQNKRHKLTEQEQEKLNQYKALEAEGGTDYEKTSRILDKYLAENDENYQALKDKLSKTKDPKQTAEIEKQLRQKRDNIIHDWQAVVNPGIDNRSLSLKDRQRGIREIGKIFTVAGTKGKKGKELNELAQPEVLNRIKSNKYELRKLEEILKDIDFNDPNVDADTKLHQLADSLLKNDPKYQSLTGEAKEEYLQNKVAATVSDFFAIKIDKEDLKGERANLLKNTLVSMIGNAEKVGLSLEEISSSEDFKHKLLDGFKKQTAYIENIKNENDKRDVLRFKNRLEISCKLEKTDGRNNTEKDILIYLEKHKDELSPEQKDLLAYYKEIEKIEPSLLNEEIDLKNGISISIIMGRDIKQIGEKAYAYVKEAKTESQRNQRMEEFGAKFFKGCANESVMVKKYAQQYADDYYNGDITKVKIKGSIGRAARSIANLNIDPKNKELQNNASVAIGAAIGDKNLSAAEKKQLENIGKGIKSKDGILYGQIMSHADVIAASKSNPDNLDIVTKGFNSAHSHEASYNANAYIAAHSNDKTYTTLFTKSNIKTSDPAGQKYLGEKLLELHNEAVTEGVAAAEKFVDASVKEAYSQNLNNEINSGHYTEEQKANFQTARETGQTSYERTQASEGAKSNSSEHSVSNQQSNDAGSTQTVYSTGSKSSSINVSPQTQSIARETKTLIALNSQLNSENKKAEAMKKAADNIAKIQKDAIEREDSKAKQQEIKLQKQKLEEAKKENEKKSEEQLKAELSKVVDASIQEVQNELPQSAEGAVARQMLGDMYKNLKSYAQAGQLNQVYELLAKIPKAQELFIEKLATKHISVISHFIKTADKSVIRQLCELNPALISVLDKNTLLSIGIDKAKIIKYGDKDQIAGMLSDLQMASTKDTLNEFYEVMGIKNDEKDIEVASDALKKNDSTVDGGDDHMAKLLENMKRASSDIASSGVQGTVVPNWKEPGKKVPRELWG